MKTLPLISLLLLQSSLWIGINAENGYQAKFEVLGNGFHRDLKLSAVLPESLNGSVVTLVWHIPAGAYVDPFQLQEMEDQFLIDAEVDIEQTCRQAQPLIVRQVSASLTSWKMPVHVRYHSPSDAGSDLVLFTAPNLLRSDGKLGVAEPVELSCAGAEVAVAVPVGDARHRSVVTALTALAALVSTLALATAAAR